MTGRSDGTAAVVTRATPTFAPRGVLQHHAGIADGTTGQPPERRRRP